MQESIGSIIAFMIVILMFIKHGVTYMKINKEVDGVKTVDGIKYLFKKTDIDYITYKLNSTCLSNCIKQQSFEKTAEGEGMLTFGGISYDINRKGTDSDRNVGATFKVQMLQSGADVIITLTFVENRRPSAIWTREKKPDIVASQAYHRFFKEQFDVVVLSKIDK